MNAKSLGNQPAAPVVQTSETFQHTVNQHVGFTKRETIAMNLMAGLLASGRNNAGVEAAAIAHADRLLAELAKDGAE